MTLASTVTEDFDLGLTHRAWLDGGRLDAFLLDADGRDAFLSGSPCTAFEVRLAVEEGTAELRLPADRDWYLARDDAPWPNEAKIVSVSASGGADAAAREPAAGPDPAGDT